MTKDELLKIFDLATMQHTDYGYETLRSKVQEIAREALAEHAMREVQRLGQEIEQEPVYPDCKAKVLYECVACSSNNYPPQPEQEPVAWLLTDKNINSLQVDSIQRLINRLNHAHHTDLCVRINGQDEWFQADWLKHMVRATPPQPEQNPMSDEMLQAITDPENQPSQYGTVTLDYHFEKIKKWEDLFERMSNKVLQQLELEPVISKWVLREVYFDEDGEPISHRSPPQPEQIQPSADSNTHQPERHELQAKGEHPAPCARHCEANAFQIVIKNLKAQLAQPKQEEKLPPVEIGVDVTDIGTTVVAFYRRPNAVMEMFYSQFHPLAQPEQEPVAWADLNALSEQINSVNCGTVYRLPSKEENRQPLYTTPPQRTWVGLTDDDKVLINHDANFNQFMTAGEYADIVQQLTEARLKDLNT